MQIYKPSFFSQNWPVVKREEFLKLTYGYNNSKKVLIGTRQQSEGQSMLDEQDINTPTQFVPASSHRFFKTPGNQRDERAVTLIRDIKRDHFSIL